MCPVNIGQGNNGPPWSIYIPAAYPMEINVYSVQDQGTPAQPQGSVELIRFTRYRYAPKDSYRYWYMAELILQI